jgi:uncharacterized protein HemY
MMEELGLRTLPLWILEGDYDHVRAARGAAKKFSENPFVYYELGIWALISQDWAAAEKHLRRAAELGRPGAYLPLRAYVLCRGGEIETGKRLKELFERSTGEGDPLVELLEEVCAGVPDPASLAG